ncbi:LLM class flavin-dependent oxidoreductase [Glaciimonas sp. CA11.2]|uniref:LLM class flavin-dependent oxidoreductase n=1 Tax=unclassified Glaciimonas TaxID=2644401 RepID=UPI002AB3393C|nr:MULTISPECIES: LLM class flavin-dependent oxidoreductase [unclassified Glaciimonas]MDY7546121.1 LLM class flavin-dependent oxidoreductase [Glaciimonas sp. CA11.2]MEB0010924.1 LLM class flavin-dependent oxidoreductase [Glaciimonas sp. Cout2]MEB0081706.1 LLM class flavin-dependent oxidoreductase [Glaciimonas sp. Gout2]MEB0161817.1 LLM class flavin-dependent oxidoreductase [Glaciimonas sp. CA11.2]
MANKQMALVAFLQAQNCSNLVASWRHPETNAGYLTPEYYQDIARTLEAGKFHLAFFDDRLAMPDVYGDSHADTVRNGVRAVKLDPVVVLTAMGLATKQLGLGATYSTTYYEPFHVARVFSTLDAMTRGRVAWNVVTSLNDSEANNFGVSKHQEHDLRYDRADEFLEVVLGHWDTWHEGALVGDKAANLFADPDKVRRLDHHGEFFNSRGPFTVPRSEQGHPVLIQAGQSGRGSEFAARWGELVFVIQPNIEVARKRYQEFKAKLAAHGRDPDSVRVAPAIYAVVASSKAEAEDRRAAIDALVQPIDSLALLSEVLNFDFSSKRPDDQFTDDELSSISGLRAILDRVILASGKKNPTLAEFLKFSGRGTTKELPTFVGSPTDVADQLEEWFTGGACDGFVLAATHMPGTYREFVQLVVPELQRRGLFQKEYAGTTLRENLGLSRPNSGDWKKMYR